MLGAIFILAGVVCIILGGFSASRYLDAGGGKAYFSLSFFSTVIAPLLGGAILLVIGLKEFS